MKYCSTIAVALILAGCRGNDQSGQLDPNSSAVFINIADQSPIKDHFASFLENISYVALETNENSLLVNPQKAFHVKDRFYIVDGQSNAVKVFDNGGKYLFDVGGVGKGPGEFLDIKDVQLSPDTTALLVLSNNSRAIYKYDLNGTFLGKKDLKFWASDFCFLPDNEMAFYINYNVSDYNGPFNLLVTDTLGNLKEKYFYFGNGDTPSFAFTGFLRPTATTCLYANAYSDTIFEIGSEQISARYIFDFGENNTRMKDVKNPASRKNLSAFANLGNQVLENDEALFFNYVYKRKLGFGIFIKNTNELITREAFKIDYLSSIFSTPIGISADNNKLISMLHPARILYLIKNDPDFLNRVRQEDSRLYDFIKDLDETKNQLLMTFDIK